MNMFTDFWNKYIGTLLTQLGYDILENVIIANATPDISKGDIAYPMFPICKHLRSIGINISPTELAQKIVDLHKEQDTQTILGSLVVIGPYVNVFLKRDEAMQSIIENIVHTKNTCDTMKLSDILQGTRMMIEFSAPNTNKPLHIGHLRNNVIGESLSRILSCCGAEVRKVNLINDRGIHICKSMLAYQKFGEGRDPKSEGVKGDRFVGNYYVEFAKWAKTHAEAEEEAQRLLVRYESGDEQVKALWQKMNAWALAGIEETYKKTHTSFDVLYKESETYMLGKQVIEKGLAQGVFYKNNSGMTLIDLDDIGLDTKVVLRADGTSVYITQDLGTAYVRHADWPCDTILYIVAHEQNYHFTVLFHILEKLGFEPACKKSMHHIGYGMVHLPHGRMKSREGTVIDADDLLDEIATLVQKEICARGKDKDLSNLKATCSDVALAAVHYFLLNIHIKKDVIFNPESSISFQGNTGPYLQYTCARIANMLYKFKIPKDQEDWNACMSDMEWELAYKLSHFQYTLQQAALKYDPSILARYTYECACLFASFYQSMPIATCDEVRVKKTRMLLSQATLHVLKNALYLLNIPYIEKM